MTDIETVITHLHIIKTWADFARERDLNFFTVKHLRDIAGWTGDALELLKEQPDIVRCKDCKLRYNGCCYNPVDDNWFCADGERR